MSGQSQDRRGENGRARGGAGPGGVLLSIVIPTRNRLAMLRRAVASVADQADAMNGPMEAISGPRGLEICIADDGSTDGTGAWLAGLSACDAGACAYDAGPSACNARTDRASPGLIRTVRSGGGGEAAARNAGVGLARGAWVMFLDDDDALAPGALGLVASLLRGEHGVPRGVAAIKTRAGEIGPGGGEEHTVGSEALTGGCDRGGPQVRLHATLAECLASRGTFGGIGGLIIRRELLGPEPFGRFGGNCVDVMMQLGHGHIGPVADVASPAVWLVGRHPGQASRDPVRIAEGVRMLLEQARSAGGACPHLGGTGAGAGRASRSVARVLANNLRHAIRIQMQHGRWAEAASLYRALLPLALRARQPGFVLRWPLGMLWRMGQRAGVRAAGRFMGRGGRSAGV